MHLILYLLLSIKDCAVQIFLDVWLVHLLVAKLLVVLLCLESHPMPLDVTVPTVLYILPEALGGMMF